MVPDIFYQPYLLIFFLETDLFIIKVVIDTTDLLFPALHEFAADMFEF